MPPSTKLVDAAMAFSLFLPCFFVAAQGLGPGQIISTPGTWGTTDTTPTRCAIVLPDASRRELPSDQVVAALPVCAPTIGSALGGPGDPSSPSRTRSGILPLVHIVSSANSLLGRFWDSIRYDWF
ncbi:uncharacterized protein PG986_010489 [Apiospora aurea]|uniref:Secreted protein n=1 Tax=Apiospora aurea TaxID=335848 RepID=A0ABR1Q2E0_9PEZI